MCQHPPIQPIGANCEKEWITDDRKALFLLSRLLPAELSDTAVTGNFLRAPFVCLSSLLAR